MLKQIVVNLFLQVIRYFRKKQQALKGKAYHELASLQYQTV